MIGQTMKKNVLKIALYQPVVDRDVQVNLEKTLVAIRTAAEQGAQLICFPEIQFSPFFPQYPARDASGYAFTLDHPVLKAMQEACRQHHIFAFPNLYLAENGSYYDATPVISSEGEIVGVSKMVHVVQMPFYYEQDYYAPSDSGFIVYDTPMGKIGVVICFDRHLPESIRSCALKGAHLVIVPTANIKGEPLDLFEWEIRVQALHNGVFIAMCNRVGREDAMDFAGESLVVDPRGGLLIKADDREGLYFVDLDLDKVESTRTALPYLRLRRPECYDLG